MVKITTVYWPQKRTEVTVTVHIAERMPRVKKKLYNINFPPKFVEDYKPAKETET